MFVCDCKSKEEDRRMERQRKRERQRQREQEEPSGKVNTVDSRFQDHSGGKLTVTERFYRGDRSL